jgi:hypothetical protein
MLSSLKNRGKGNSFFLIDNSFALENTFLYLLFSFAGTIRLHITALQTVFLFFIE